MRPSKGFQAAVGGLELLLYQRATDTADCGRPAYTKAGTRVAVPSTRRSMRRLSIESSAPSQFAWHSCAANQLMRVYETGAIQFGRLGKLR